jgi:ubiquinone/menaquinone biosynthesis C-methylase UbiE
MMVVERTTPIPGSVPRRLTPPTGAVPRRVLTPSSGVVEIEGAEILRSSRSVRGTPSTPLPTPTPVNVGPDSGPKILALVDFMDQQGRLLDGLAANPATTMEGLYDSLDNATGLLHKLGFLNAAVYRPKQIGSQEWVLTHATRGSGESVFSRGSVPDAKTSTAGWLILHGVPNEFILVDIYDPASFAAAGLPYHADRAGSDRRTTIGSGQTLYFKIVSKFGVEALIQLNNRVARKPGALEPPPLLPDNPPEARQILKILRQYFKHEVLPAIEGIHERDKTPRAEIIDQQPLRQYVAEDAKQLSVQPSYLPGAQAKIVKLRNGTRVKVETIIAEESIKDHFARLGRPEEFESLRSDCCIVTSLASGVNKEQSVDAYLANANVLLAARDVVTDRFIGYVAVEPQRILGNHNIFIWANYEMGDYQSIGLGTELNYQAVKLGRRMLEAKRRSPLYMSFRTWSPAAYKIALRKGAQVFPMPNKDGTGLQREPSPIEVSVFTKVAQDVLRAPIDVNTAIMANVVEPAKNVNWLGIPRVDNFFRDIIGIAKGNAVLVTVKLPRFVVYLQPIRELWVRFVLRVKKSFRRLSGAKKEVRVDWAEYFRAYDVLSSFIPYRDLLRRMGELLEISEGDTVLDLGSGTGNMSQEIERRGGQVVAFDNSTAGIAIHRGKSRTARLFKADLDLKAGRFLPLADNSFDKVSGNNVVNYLGGRPALYRELHRVIRPGGILALSIIGEGFSPIHVLREHMRAQYRELRKSRWVIWSLVEVFRNFVRIYPQLRIIGAANAKILKGVASGSVQLFKEDRIRQELTEAGFDIVSIEKGYAGEDYIVKATPRK